MMHFKRQLLLVALAAWTPSCLIAAEGRPYRLLVPRHKPAPVVEVVKAAEPKPVAPRQMLAYQELPAAVACTRLALGLQASDVLVTDGPDLPAAKRGATAVISYWRVARDKAFMTMADLPGARSELQRRGRVMDTLALLGMALGRDVAGMVTDVNDLRQLPFMIEDSQVVLLVSRRDGLTPDRLEKVEKVAKQRGVALSLVWIGERLLADEARDLALLAQMTGGLVLDVSEQARVSCEP